MACGRRFRLLVVLSAALLNSLTEALPQRAVRQRALNGDRPTTQWLCQRPECECFQDDQGLESVECDCVNADQKEALLLGDLSAFISDRTKDLHVRQCKEVVLQSQALSQAVSLERLQLTDIETLNLQPLSVYTNNGPAKTIEFRNIANFSVESAAFQQVRVLEKLLLDNITAEIIPEGLFGIRTDVIDFAIKNSKIEFVEELRLPKADSVTVENCQIDELNMDVEDVLKVNITGNSIDVVNMLHFNVQPNFHSNDNKSVTISNNEIMNMDSESMQMIVDKFFMFNNTIDSLSGPLRVNFAEAQIMENTFNKVSPASFAAMRQLDALNIRFRAFGQPEPVPYALVFAKNTMLSPTENETFELLLFPDNLNETNTLFHVYENQFRCGCSALRDLVETGDRAFLAAANTTDATEVDDEDPVVEAHNLAQVLYTTSVCEDSRPLSQYRLTAYDSDYMCLEDGSRVGPGSTAAASTAIALLTAAAAAAAILV